MIYVTIKQNQRHIKQLTFDDLLDGKEIIPINHKIIPTVTFKLAENSDNYNNLLQKYPIRQMQNWLITFAETHQNTPKEYNTFYIPKRSGGMRRIDAPEPPLMNVLAEVKNSLEQNFFTLAHNDAHAYTTGRSTVTAMQVHQRNNSRWFLKLDFKNFFPAHNAEYILLRAKQIFPFSAVLQDPEAEIAFKQIIDLGLLENKLPQGTPLSPLLTNILMAPVDYEIKQMLNQSTVSKMVYTRYADDLIISSPYHFKRNEIETEIEKILNEMHCPFRLNKEKTRYGSSAGRNWNLGIMLNKDNNLTIGHKQNQRFRAAIFNFATDLQNGRPWDIMDAHVLLGQISYYRAIEVEYINEVLKRYSQKFNMDIEKKIKQTISGYR